MNRQKIVIIKNNRVLITGTGNIFINNIRVSSLIIRGSKYYEKHLILKNKFCGIGKIRQVREIIETEVKRLRGLTLEEALLAKGYLQE